MKTASGGWITSVFNFLIDYLKDKYGILKDFSG